MLSIALLRSKNKAAVTSPLFDSQTHGVDFLVATLVNREFVCGAKVSDILIVSNALRYFGQCCQQ